MDETDLIESLQMHLAGALSVPVRTSGMDDERPVPVVIIEDWDTNDKNYNNSALAGEFGSGVNYERYLNFDFKTRVELLVRHSDEVDVSRLKERAKHELRMISENPQNFHPDLKSCHLGAGGNPTYQFLEPKEAELMLSARFYGDHTVTITPGDTKEDTLEAVNAEFSFNP